MEPPKKPIEVTLHLSGFDEDDIRQQLRDIETDFLIYGVRKYISSNNGYSDVVRNEPISKEDYYARLHEWSEERRANKAKDGKKE